MCIRDSTATIFEAILNRTPVPPVRLNPNLSAEFERIISKALEKDRELRYQNAADLRSDLKRLRRDFDSTRSTAGRAAEQAAEPQWDKGSDSQVVAGVLQRHRREVLAAVALLLVLLAAAGYGVYHLLHRPASPGTAGAPHENMQITRLTTRGNVRRAVISPDGKYVAYEADHGGEQSLWLRQVATDSNVQIVPPSRESFRGVAFSPDGTYVYFSRSAKNRPWVLYRVPALGGNAQEVIEDVDSPVTFSPDGSQFAFVRLSPAGDYLMVAKLDGSGARTLATFNKARGLWQGAPGWSPDGKAIVVSTRTINEMMQSELIAVSAEGGAEQRIPTPNWYDISQFAWLPGNDALVVVASQAPGPNASRQIWRLSYPAGVVSRVTNDLSDYSGVSLSRDGSSLVTVQSRCPPASGSPQEVMPPRRDGSAVQRETSTDLGAWIGCWTAELFMRRAPADRARSGSWTLTARIHGN